MKDTHIIQTDKRRKTGNMRCNGCVKLNMSRLLGVTLLHVMSSLPDVISQQEGVQEYCEDATFEGRCAEDEVIVMTSARYGRMRLGTCVLRNYGHQGCTSDILRNFDLWCSGRPSCDVAVSDLLTRVPQPCPQDLRNYLEASYTCVKVVWPTVQRCRTSNPLVTSESGYLSNYVTEQTECGAIDAPWTIHVPKGQQINLTLYDFAQDPTVNTQSSICQVLAVIKDMGVGATSATKTICNGFRREQQIMMSQTNKVEVRFVLKSQTHEGQNHEGRYHIIKFEAVGCADLEAPGMWFHRTLSTARVGCDGVDGSWQLVCQGKVWKGDVPDCSNESQLPQNVIMDSASSVPYGVSVAIILAIALLIGAVILTIGLVVIRRRRTRAPRGVTQPDLTKMAKDDCYVERIPYSDHNAAQGYTSDIPYNGENTYYRTWELQRHAPHGSTMQHATGSGAHTCAASVPPGYQGTRMREDSPPPYLEHIYESPKSVRRDLEAMGSDSLKYYELDPSINDNGKRGKDPDVTS